MAGGSIELCNSRTVKRSMAPASETLDPEAPIGDYGGPLGCSVDLLGPLRIII